MTFSQGNDMRFVEGLFRSVDRNGDGEIDAGELQAALSNGTHVPFNPKTIDRMMKMFDPLRRGKINLEGFINLWKYVNDWQQIFHSIDQDRSGFIDSNELNMALQRFGYRLSPSITSVMLSTFDRQGKKALAFDDFIECCIVLHKVTESFKGADTDRDGVITIGFEQFIHMALDFL